MEDICNGVNNKKGIHYLKCLNKVLTTLGTIVGIPE